MPDSVDGPLDSKTLPELILDWRSCATLQYKCHCTGTSIDSVISIMYIATVLLLIRWFCQAQMLYD